MVYDGDTKKIIDEIRHKMIDTNTRQKDIVDKLGLSKSTVSNFLSCKSKNPTLDTLKMFCDAMDCDLIIEIQKREN